MIAGFFCLSATSHAATRYAEVGGDGPASGDDACPLSNPCELQAAVEDASVVDGDEVVVLPGTYDIGANTLMIDNRILVRGQGPEQRPLITGLGDEWLVRVQSGNGPQVAQLRDVNVSATGTANSLIVGPGEVNRVSVDHNGTNFSVACQLGAEAAIHDSVCFARSPNGAGLVFSLFGGTVANSVRNVTAASVQSDGIQVVSGSGSHTLNIKNTIASGNQTDIRAVTLAGGASTVNASNSNYSTVVEENGASITPVGTADNQTAEPIFENFGLGDFHQAPDSPTIDGGADGVSAVDLDGQPRFQGLLPDIGAFEHDAIPPETTIVKQPSRRTRSRRARLKFSSNEQDSSFRCKADQKPYRNCSSPFKLTGLKPGRHMVFVTAVDAAGNEDPTADLARWRVLR